MEYSKALPFLFFGGGGGVGGGGQYLFFFKGVDGWGRGGRGCGGWLGFKSRFITLRASSMLT